MLVSKEELYGINKTNKYFNGYSDNDMPLDLYACFLKWLVMLKHF